MHATLLHQNAMDSVLSGWVSKNFLEVIDEESVMDIDGPDVRNLNWQLTLGLGLGIARVRGSGIIHTEHCWEEGMQSGSTHDHHEEEDSIDVKKLRKNWAVLEK